MTTKETAAKLVSLCREGKFEEAQKELFAADAVSVEQQESPAFAKETRGLPAIYEKGKKFNSMVEQVHSVSVSEPVVSANSFACTLSMDVTMKGKGRMNMAELCVYEVKDGKITAERFFM